MDFAADSRVKHREVMPRWVREAKALKVARAMMAQGIV